MESTSLMDSAREDLGLAATPGCFDGVNIDGDEVVSATMMLLMMAILKRTLVKILL